MGDIYYDGEVVEKDLVTAVKWYKKAANNNNMYGQYKLGHCYLFKEGIAQNSQQAIYWLERAANQNCASAQKLLGECYENGWGVDIDIEKANEYYTLAQSNGYNE